LWSDTAAVRGKAIGVFRAEFNPQAGRMGAEVAHRVLRDATVVVFDLHRHFGRGEQGQSHPNDLGEFGRVQTMVRIVSDPDLQHAGRLRTHGSTAVDEVLLHAGDFGHVKMGGDHFAVGELGLHGAFRVLVK
jgi:hypothetical protein